VRIQIACPAAPGSRQGNRVTALRWARILRGLGHRVRVGRADEAGDPDLLIALHARRSAPAIEAFRRRRADRPLIVALTGTDLYLDLPRCGVARRSLELADRLIVLQRAALCRLPAPARGKARVVHQSVTLPA
jgi:hypothetical protein